MRSLLFFALLFLAIPAAGQNLIDDGSFEDGNVAACTLGLVPDTWFHVMGTPDTFTEDCGLSPGASLGQPPGHFATLGGTPDGLRFLAASNDPVQPDGFGQLLAAPLAVGQTYRIGAQVARSSQTTATAPLDVYLGATASFSGAALLGTLQMNPLVGAWSEGFLVFCPPTDAASRSYLLIRPRVGLSTAYLATDAWELVPIGDPCEIIPGPGVTSLTALALLLLALGLTTSRRARRYRI